MPQDHMVKYLDALLKQFLAVGLCAGHFTCLSLMVFTCEMEIKNCMAPQVCCEDEIR